ncbi:metalloregulator ArsR/SmtB family transcription factor [Granulicella sp. dw_53]|uniref:ArsR/SmtB family transcription factor n=1 Tax=Granulicella sp. dw_53 TaxID=2719792 RepID=UPI0021034934|nr:metalloregulator ArsR/SmtB family transcription factor [Granulicella sp. dw_53]
MAEMTEREFRAISKAIGEPRRFQILRHIARTDCMACSDLRTQFPISAATLSHHLKELESAGLIDTERRGKFMDAKFRKQVWQGYLAELRLLLTECEFVTPVAS